MQILCKFKELLPRIENQCKCHKDSLSKEKLLGKKMKKTSPTWHVGLYFRPTLFCKFWSLHPNLSHIGNYIQKGIVWFVNNICPLYVQHLKASHEYFKYPLLKKQKYDKKITFQILNLWWERFFFKFRRTVRGPN